MRTQIENLINNIPEIRVNFGDNFKDIEFSIYYMAFEIDTHCVQPSISNLYIFENEDIIEYSNSDFEAIEKTILNNLIIEK